MPAPDPATNPAAEISETAQLAKGGRTSFIGYLLRLVGRFPFLFIAGRLYGAEALGRFAYAIMIVELVAMFATLGLKRGLAEDMAMRRARASRAHPADAEAHSFYDALLVSFAAAVIGAALLTLLPQIVFPASRISTLDRLFPLIVIPIVLSEVSLAALAFRLDIATSVRARAIVEPWVLSFVALGLAFTVAKPDGLELAYIVSMVAAAVASMVPAMRNFGLVKGWRPDPATLFDLVRKNLALSGADIALWGGRRLDIFILGRFASPEVVGIYYIAQQFASLPQRVNSSFDAILAPVLARNLAAGQLTKVAQHVRQIGFWVGASQMAVVLGLGITGKASMGLFGPIFASGVVVLALLLVTELFAAQAAVAESALVYLARGRNLAWSAAGMAIQAGLSLLLVPRYGGEGAAAALAIAALVLSIAKSRLLARLLDHPVAGWRWSIAIAGVPAFGVGLLFLQTPEWVQLGIGQWLVVASFCGIIWRFGFKGDDRLLFTRQLAGDAMDAPAPIIPAPATTLSTGAS